MKPPNVSKYFFKIMIDLFYIIPMIHTKNTYDGWRVAIATLIIVLKTNYYYLKVQII